MKKHAASFLIIIGIILYALTLKGVAGNPVGENIRNNLDSPSKPFELSPERDRYVLTYSLAEYGRFDLSQTLADVAWPDVGYYQGRFYIYFAPGISLYALPLYLVGKLFHAAQLFVFAGISLFAIANLIIIFRLAGEVFQLSTRFALLASLIFGFASNSWPYAVTMYQHNVTAFFLLTGIYCTWKWKQETEQSLKYPAYIWLFYALAIWIDYPNTILLLPMMVYFFLTALSQKQRLIGFFSASIVFILLTGIHGLYNAREFGNPLRVSGSLLSYRTVKEQNLLTDPQGPERVRELQQKKNPAKFFKITNTLQGIFTLLLSRERGIFYYYPIFILGVLGTAGLIRRQWKKKEMIPGAVLTFLVFVPVNILLYASFNDPQGGWAFGPRYLIPTMAVGSLFAARWLQSFRTRTWAVLTFFLLSAYSTAVALVGVLTTNAVPPESEGVGLNTPSDFFLNIEYLTKGVSSSFLYNDVFASLFTLQAYFFLIYLFVLLIFFSLIYGLVSKQE